MTTNEEEEAVRKVNQAAAPMLRAKTGEEWAHAFMALTDASNAVLDLVLAAIANDQDA